MPANQLTITFVGDSTHLLRGVACAIAAGYQVRVVAHSPDATITDLADHGYITLTTTADPDCVGERCAAEDIPQRFATPTLPAMWARLADGFSTGQAWLVGAGPGPAELVTVGALAAVHRADVVITDRLVPMSTLAVTRSDATIIDVAKIPHGRSTSQERINELIVQHAKTGARVVRLKGGDPFVFGRGMEEVQACAAAGITTRVLPGISSSIAVPGLAGIPATHRGITQGVVVVSGHVPPGHAASTTDWAAIARSGCTIVVLMGVANAAAIARALLEAGLAADLPTAAITHRGIDQSPRLSAAKLSQVGANGLGLPAPAVWVIGDVVGLLGG